MCYSAQIETDYRKYVKASGGHVDMLRAAGWPTPRMFDDVTVKSGNARLAGIRAAIPDAATRHKIFVLAFEADKRQNAQASCDGRSESRSADIATSKRVADHYAGNTAQSGHRQSRENSWMSGRACAPWHSAGHAGHHKGRVMSEELEGGERSVASGSLDQL
jgi:hypothetical protein